jgi:hypothetical protein
LLNDESRRDERIAAISVQALLERATMSQKSYLPQPTQSVSRGLTADSPQDASITSAPVAAK